MNDVHAQPSFPPASPSCNSDFPSGGLLAGRETGRQGPSAGNGSLPAPSNYRDSASADRLSAYLRSEALPLVGARRGGATEGIPETVGTFGALDERARQQGLTVYRTLFEQGVGIVATGETALASQAAATYQREPTVEATP